MVLTLSGTDAAVTASILVPILTLAANLLDNIMNIEVTADREEDARNIIKEPSVQVFDFVIVGGGSAGCVLANRLSENLGLKILLLDAGGIPTQLQQIPIIAYALNNQKSVDWAYRTIPQSHAAFGLNYNISNWPAGKTLGGSSGIHGMINIRGNVQGFDRIAQRTGDSIWKMENILRYYRRVENYKGVFNPRGHGHRGQLSVEEQTVAPFTYNLLRAGRELGYPTRDPNSNGPNVPGLSPIEFYEKFGRRADAYLSSLKPILPWRPNLTLRKFSFVTRLLIRKGNEVYGVEYDRHGKRYIARATKEVILAAGALSTPKILMLSGIGPADHLAQFKIPLVANLPVGLNLQDKYGALVGPFTVAQGSGKNQNRDVNISSTIQWLTTGKGIVGSGGTEATWVINSRQNIASGDSYYPDVHTYVFGFTPTENYLTVFQHSFNFNDASIKYYKKTIGTHDAFFQLVTINRSFGNGHVRLQDSDPYSPLIINPRYLQHPRDISALIDGIRFSVDLVEKTRAFREINGRLYPLPFPGCEGHRFKSDSYYECIARYATVTAYKYCGTATLGKDQNDPNAVVDSRFRVFGVQKLRVIDGSLFKSNDVNTNDVTVRMLAELGSDVIRQHWQIR